MKILSPARQRTRRGRHTGGLVLMVALAIPSVQGLATGATSAAATHQGLNYFRQQVKTAYAGNSVRPPTSAPTPPKTEDAWIISCGQFALGCSVPVAAAQAAASALGWQVHVADGMFGANDGYNTAIRQALAAHATVIMLVGVDCTDAKASLTEAKAAGVPVIAAQSFDCNNPVLNGGPPLFTASMALLPRLPTASAWNTALGATKADWLVAATGGRARVLVVTVEGITDYIYQDRGFTNELKKCATCRIVGIAKAFPPDLLNGVLQQSFSSLLSAHPEANAVYVDGDSTVTAAEIPQAIQSAGRTQSTKVIGTEGFPQNLGLIRRGAGQNAAVPYDPGWIGWGLVDTTVRALDHRTALPEGLGWTLVNSAHGLPPAGQAFASPINYKSVYERAWGISGGRR